MKTKKSNRNDICPCGSGKKYKNCCLERDDALASRKRIDAASIANIFQKASEHLRAGQLIEAETLCQQILQVEPNKPEVLHMLGVIAYQAGMHDVAVELISGALNFAPNIAEAHYNLGNAYKEQRMLAEAVASYQRAVSLKPDYAVAYSNLGDLLQTQGKSEEAAESFRQALRIKPDLALVHYNLATVLQGQGKLAEAIASFQNAIELSPNFAEAHCNLGNVLFDQGKSADAVDSYRKALRFKPDYASAYSNLGNVLKQQGKLEEAADSYRQALRLQPYLAKGHYGLAVVLQRQGKHAEALVSARNAISLEPDFAEAYNALGELLRCQGKLDEAVENLHQALKFRANYADAFCNLGNALMDQGKLEDGIESFRQALRIKPDFSAAYSNLLFTSQYLGDLSPTELFSEHLRFAAKFEEPFRSDWPAHTNSREPARRLKIGYVSADFRDHSVAYFIEPILANHDRSQVEVYCYYNYAVRDRRTDAIAAHADHWLNCAGMADQDLANRIRADGIDILVDLSGHTADNRLLVFARKPAPVQATWIGMSGTTGLSAMNYRITDEYEAPPGLYESYHSEELIRLPDTGTAYQPEPDCPPVNSLPALSSGRLVLACLNNLVKVNSRVLGLWARLLVALPDAQLLLGNVTTPEIENHLVQRLARSGIPRDRVILRPRMVLRDYLAMHHEIDLALDPFPYGGGTTTMHSLWMGVPVLTLAGEQVASRHGAWSLSRVGLKEFITYSEQEYFERALEICRDLPALDRVRQSLRDRTTNMRCDAASITRHLEEAYRKMWTKWCASS